jgi:hypothetical protein
VLVEGEGPSFDPAELTGALRLAPPYRARAVRQDEVWVVAARRIEVVELEDDPRGDDVELAWDGTERSVRVDGEPTMLGMPELERLGAQRHDAYVVTARRLAGRVWEVAVSAL